MSRRAFTSFSIVSLSLLALTRQDDASDEPVHVRRSGSPAQVATGWFHATGQEIGERQLAGALAIYQKRREQLAYDVGKEAGSEVVAARRVDEDARRGGPHAALVRASNWGLRPLEHTLDPDLFDEYWGRIHEEEDYFFEDLEELASAVPGTTLELDEGCFRFSPARFGWHTGVPDEFTVEGAGMDATLVVLDREFSGDDGLRRLDLRDCTVHTNGMDLLDQRGGGASITMERVRVVGFDSGRGRHCVFGAREGLMLRATDCEFIGGYGLVPSGGMLYGATVDALIARFEGCLFQDLWPSLEMLPRTSAVAVVDSRLIGMSSPVPLATVDAANRWLVIDGCEITETNDYGESFPKRDLNDLFPDWEARLE